MATNEIFDNINKIPILDVLSALGMSYKKTTSPNQYVGLKDDGRVDESFQINTLKNIATNFGGNGEAGGPFDIAGRLLGHDTQSTTGRSETVKWFVDKGLVADISSPKQNKRSLKGEQLFEDFDNYKLGGYKNEISAFLMTRGFPHLFIQKNSILFGTIFKDVGYYEDYFTTEEKVYQDDDGQWQTTPGDIPKTVPIFMFPCHNENGERVGMKMRRKDGKKIRGKKSPAVVSTGLWWDEIREDVMYIVEGEMDAIVLWALGFKGVVANLGGVQSNKSQLKSLLYKTSKIICLYDNDEAGQHGMIALANTIGRKIYTVEYPFREDINGNRLSDINDFYRAGFDTAKKFNEIFAKTIPIGETSKDGNNNAHRYIFLDKTLEFYDTKYNRVQDSGKISASMGMTGKELNKLVIDNVIKKYIDTCYWHGGKDGYYNTLSPDSIMLDGGDEPPVIHPDIEALINNIGGHKIRNIEWIHRAILFKLTHINSVSLPALVLYGVGRSGKGTFIKLLSKIFGEENTLRNLGQRDLERGSDSYSGEKLIVEFQEVSSGNTFQDKKVVDRIKSLVGESKITVKQLYRDPTTIDNTAWFHFSSNHTIPLQLDSGDSGNDRFTIIHTPKSLSKPILTRLHTEVLTSPKYIRQYIAWLFETHPDVPKLTMYPSLINTEKKLLEENCDNVGNQFFAWLEEKYPHIWKISNKQKNILLSMYRDDIGDNDRNDQRYKQKNFDMGLSHKYMKKAIRVNDSTTRGYFINKETLQKGFIPDDSLGEFTKQEWVEVMNTYNSFEYDDFTFGNIKKGNKDD